MAANYRFIMLELSLFLVAVFTTSGFGGDCQCNMTVCHCISDNFISAVMELDDTTTSLTFRPKTNNTWVIVDLEEANLTRFANLTRLDIDVFSSKQQRNGHLRGLNSPGTFNGLHNLRSLLLNVFVKEGTGIARNIFQPLTALRELNLSYAQTLNLSSMEQTFQHMAPTTALNILKLRSVQSYASNIGYTTKLNLTSFLEPFERNQSLEILDISRNGLTNIDPGIFRHPQLKELYLHENFIAMSGLFVEIILHQSLEIVVLDYQGCSFNGVYKPKLYKEYIDSVEKCKSLKLPITPYPQNTLQDASHGRGKVTRTHLDKIHSPTLKFEESSKQRNHASPFPKLGIPLISSLSAQTKAITVEVPRTSINGSSLCKIMKTYNMTARWMHGLNCADFPDDVYITTDDTSCNYNITLIGARQLRELHAAHYSYFLGEFHNLPQGTWCLSPNNSLKLLDLSSLGTAGQRFAGNRIRVKGLDKLEVLNLEESQFLLSQFNFTHDLRGLRSVLCIASGMRSCTGSTQCLHVLDSTMTSLHSNTMLSLSTTVKTNGGPITLSWLRSKTNET